MPEQTLVLSRRAFRLSMAFLAVLYVTQGLYYARMLAPGADGIQFLGIGAKVVRGELSVFDDGFPGNRMPLPFYVLGLTQLPGPNLVIPRVMNVAFGLGTLALVAALARRLAGDLAGVLAGAFLATQGVVIAYYSYEGYPAFAAFMFAVAVFTLFSRDSPGHRALGTGFAATLFFVRSNLWPAVPFLLGYSLWRASGSRERILLSAVVAIPPVIFLAWDPAHLKILAYVPVLNRLVAPLGYDAREILVAQGMLPLAEQLQRVLMRIIRRYEFWMLAAATLVALFLWRWSTGRPVPRWRHQTQIVVLAAFLVYMFAASFAMFRMNWGWVGIYFASFAPLMPVLLGIGFSGLLDGTPARSRARRVLIVILGCLLLPPLYWVRNPLLPIGEVRARDPFAAAHRAADRLRQLVPQDAKVFFYGSNTAYYLAGLPTTYLGPTYNADAFTGIQADPQFLSSFGLVHVSDLTYWLSRDADFAVIDMIFFESRSPSRSADNPELIMQNLLARHFTLIGTVDEPPFIVNAVYRRKTGASGGARG